MKSGMNFCRMVGRVLGVGLLMLGLGQTAFAQTFSDYDIPPPFNRGIAKGPNGTMWFTELYGNRIGRIDSAGVITEYPLPHAESGPSRIAAGPDGAMWFTEINGNRIGRITMSGDITEYPLNTAGALPTGIVSQGGFLWFTQPGANSIGRLDPATGAIAEKPLPNAGSSPIGITVGPDNALWFTEGDGNRIGRLDPVTASLFEYDVAAGSYPMDIVTGKDGALWFTAFLGNFVGRMSTAGGLLNTYALSANSLPMGIVATASGNIWFAESGASNRFGRISGGVLAEAPVLASNFTGPRYLAVADDDTMWFTNSTKDIGHLSQGGLVVNIVNNTASAKPRRIVAGPDGALWFTEDGGNRIGRMTTTGGITEFRLPTPGTARPLGITVGPDGALWFAERGRNSVGRVTTDGVVTEFSPAGPAGSFVNQITMGPDGNLWFGGSAGIGRITPAGDVTFKSVNGAPQSITAGPDGAMWFAEYAFGVIGRITLDMATVTEVATLPPGSHPHTIVMGPDGALWFTQEGDDQIGRYAPANNSLSQYPLLGGAMPQQIITGPDGALWFTQSGNNRIGRIKTGDGFTEFTPGGAGLGLDGLTFGPDGALWFTQLSVNKIGRMSMPAQAPTTITLNSNHPLATIGQSVTLSAAITTTPVGGTPTGTIMFMDGGIVISGCEAKPVTTFVATGAACTYTFAFGTHNITAMYSGDAANKTSTSANFVQEVGKVGTTSAVTSGGSPSVVNQAVEFTAAVTAQSGGIPTGKVTFNDSGNAIAGCTNLNLNNAGTQSCIVTFSSPGDHPITVTYQGNGTYAESTSPALNQQVSATLLATTTTVTTSQTPAAIQQVVTLTATVATNGQGTPNGTVTFQEFGFGFAGCGGAKTLINGVATCSVASLAAGSHNITATYVATSTYAASTSPILVQVITKIPTTVDLTSSANPSVYQQPVDFKVTVATDSGGSVIGNVTFFDAGTAITGCTNMALNAFGIATCSISTLSTFTHPITVAYAGNATYAMSASTVPLNQTVLATKISTTTSLASSVNPSAANQNVTFTATVAPVAGNFTPTGTVIFKYSNNPINQCNNPVTLVSGVAKCVISTLTVADHSITAEYSGSNLNKESFSEPLIQTVLVVKDTTTSLSASPSSPTITGQNVTFTVAVTPVTGGGPVPTGTVVFQDGGTTIASCAAVTLAGGSSSCTLNTLDTNPHTIKAVYTGDPFYNGSNASISHTVNAAQMLSLQSVQSRKNHGIAGDFDLPIATAAGQPITIEPRLSSGGVYHVVFKFSGQVGAVGNAAAADADSGAAIGTATAFANGSEVIVALLGIPDSKKIKVSLNFVNGFLQAYSANVVFVAGDISQGLAVNASDISAIKAHAATLQAANPTNFRFDLDGSGVIDLVDVNIAKSRSGNPPVAP